MDNTNVSNVVGEMGKIIYYLLIIYNALLSCTYIIYNEKISYMYYFFSLIIFIFILINNSRNILFFVRTFFLGIIGFIALGAKIVSENALFGYHMHDSQTTVIATLMFLLTNIALFSSEMGILLGEKTKITTSEKIYFENKTFFYFVYLLLFIIIYIMTFSNGSLIMMGGTYADGSGTTLPINNLNIFSNILLFTLILVYFKFNNIPKLNSKKYFYLIVLISCYLFIYAQLLRGVRMDALNGIFGAIILYLIYNNKSLKVTPKILILGVLLFILIQLIGILRGALSFLELDDIISLLMVSFNNLIYNENASILFYQGTINDIATTFSGIILLLKNNVIEFYYGGSYIDYIFRTPPQFLYPDRPKDLAWIFENNGFTSGGGFFELAEAYLNFGIFGVFIIPFIISFLFSISYKMFILNKYSLFHSILLFSLLSGFMRGLLYQTFTFYKSIITGIIIYLILFSFLAFLKFYKKSNLGNKI